ncbi:MAG: filamentous hemagglutinin N-terminal domain-containing protein, partial [Xanthobacteraceae bacterium]|nr:filamentous hemagglutinin N-terminal domain-containing protein [Xanthobacteraceae bacterium]
MRRARQILLLGSALWPLLGTGAAAGPQGPSVVGGSATVHNPGSANVVVNQSSQRAVINWHMFNIGAGETTTFNTPGASAVTLNRVTGGMGPSQILGTLTSNGQVFIVNRDGFVFGANAVVNTAGFLATTHDIRNEDFMAGHYRFDIPGRPDASIVNLGTITAANGGFAALVAPGVRNAGTITATLGSVGLAASGNGFTLDLYGDRLITLGVNDQVASQVIDVATGQPLSTLVGNSGTLSANGGRVELTAAAARQVVDQVINTSGVIEANTIGTKGGQIVLGAATGASKPAGAPKQTVRVSGTLSAAGKTHGQKGGRVVVTGENIELAGATIDASGVAGGGKVLIGGDTGGGQQVAALSHPGAQHESFAVPTASAVSVDSSTTINASATDSGNGGKVVLWSDG